MSHARAQVVYVNVVRKQPCTESIASLCITLGEGIPRFVLSHVLKAGAQGSVAKSQNSPPCRKHNIFFRRASCRVHATLLRQDEGRRGTSARCRSSRTGLTAPGIKNNAARYSASGIKKCRKQSFMQWYAALNLRHSVNLPYERERSLFPFS